MVCTKCGCEQGAPARFCRQCGAPIEAAMPQQSSAWTPNPATYYAQAKAAEQRMRVRQNLQPLGIMWCIYGAYRILTVMIGLVFLHSMAAEGMFGQIPEPVQHLIHAALPMFGLMVIAIGSVAILAGYALLTQKSWGRILAIVLAVLALIKIPFGTALGIYTLWVLAPQASGMEWDEMTRLQA
jgi:hypothetical protein